MCLLSGGKKGVADKREFGRWGDSRWEETVIYERVQKDWYEMQKQNATKEDK